MTRAQERWLWAGGLAIVALGAFSISVLGTMVWWALWVFVAAMSTFRLAAGVTALMTAKPGAQAPARWTAPLPDYAVLAPLYREANVVGELVNALAALDYPADKLDIQLLVEQDDTPTRLAAAHAIAQRGPAFRITVVPSGAPRTKPRALNHGLAQARGAFVTVYDAEDRPDPAQLRAALDAFCAGGAGLAAVQAPLGWWNAMDNALTSQFALEYAAQFHVILPALARWGWALPLGGTSNHFRREPLEAVGAWDPYNVTEDADLGFRFAAYGYRAGVIGPGTQEEAVTRLGAWIRQRSRWMRGFMQTAFVRLRRPGRLIQGGGLGALASLLLTVVAPVVAGGAHGVFALATMVLGVWALMDAGAGAVAPPLWAWVGMGVSYAASVTTLMVGAARAGVWRAMPQAFFAPLYWLLQAPAVFRALHRMLTAPFSWEKTAHGVARDPLGAQDPGPGPPILPPEEAPGPTTASSPAE